MYRLMISIAVVVASAIGIAGPASADTGGSANTDDGGIRSGADVNTGRLGGGGSTGRQQCTYTMLNLPDNVAVYNEDTGQPIETDGTGQWYEKSCDGTFYGSVYISRRNPRDLLEQARRYLPLPLPEPKLNPIGDQIVNLPTWMWLTGGWSSEDSSVSVPGITVTVTATPVSATWTMGDGAVVVCDGPGTAFDPSLPSSAQAPTCSHTYTRSSASQSRHVYPVSVTVRWHATWDVAESPGERNLGGIDRTTTFSVGASEVQAVNTRES